MRGEKVGEREKKEKRSEERRPRERRRARELGIGKIKTNLTIETNVQHALLSARGSRWLYIVRGFRAKSDRDSREQEKHQPVSFQFTE